MASVVKRPNGIKWIQFNDSNGKRQTLRPGKCSMKEANSLKHRVEQIRSYQSQNLGFPTDLVNWINGIGADLHSKMAATGLLQQRMAANLGDFIAEYIERRSDLATLTIRKYRTTEKRLNKFFNSSRAIQSINAGDADDFRQWLGKSVKANTVNKHIQICKTIFKYAVDKELIPKNPFDGLPSSTVATSGREYFVTAEEANKVLKSCSNSDFKVLFALARFGGLRCPSEPRELRWSDIDWDAERVLIHSPKTRNSGKPVRELPLFPELRTILSEAKVNASQEFVLPRLRDHAYNPGTHMRRIVEKALGYCWDKVFQNCRSTRQTELQKDHPTHVVVRWLGNSAKIAQDYYLQVTAGDYRKATDPANNKLSACVKMESDPKQNPKQNTDPKQNPKQHNAAESCTDSHETKEKEIFANPCGKMHSIAIPEIAVKGLEPSRP